MTTPDPNAMRLLAIKGMADMLSVLNSEYDRMDRYYTGDQPMAYLAAEIRAQLGSHMASLVINWPEVVVDSVVRRLAIEGFRLGQGGEADDELWRIFTANGLDEESPLSFSDACVHGLGYLSVWGNDDDPETPTISLESAHQVTCDYEPGGRVVRAALKQWMDGDTTYATLYRPDAIFKYGGRPSSFGQPVRLELLEEPLDNTLEAVPIVPMVNKGRLLNRGGRSELKSIAPIADAINKIVVDMLVTSDFYVTPRRWVTGLAVPAGADKARFQAEMAQNWEHAAKSKFLAAGEGVSFGQFPEATLDGFVKAANLLTSALAAIGGLPPDDLGLNTANPASAEARRAAETTLVNRVKEKHRPFGGAYVRAMRLAIAARDGVPLRAIDPIYNRMAVAWADPQTPAIAQVMDAAVKGKESGIYDTEAAQSLVGMSPVERAAVKARAEEAAAMAATADVRARVNLARELSDEPVTFTANAAVAASGLLAAAAANSATPAP